MPEPTLALSLTAKEGAKALEFYTRALGAEVVERYDINGGLAHAELKVGDSNFYLSDESAEWHATGLPPGMMSPCLFAIRSENCDRAHLRAVEAGAKSLLEPKDTEWGSRASMVLDPFGYRWSFSHKLGA